MRDKIPTRVKLLIHVSVLPIRVSEFTIRVSAVLIGVSAFIARVSAFLIPVKIPIPVWAFLTYRDPYAQAYEDPATCRAGPYSYKDSSYAQGRSLHV